MTQDEMIRALLEKMVGLDKHEAVDGPTAHKQRSTADEVREQMRSYSNMGDAAYGSQMHNDVEDVIKWMYGLKRKSPIDNWEWDGNKWINKSSPQSEKQLNAIPPPGREKCERFRCSQFARIAKGGLFAHQKFLTESNYQYK